MKEKIKKEPLAAENIEEDLRLQIARKYAGRSDKSFDNLLNWNMNLAVLAGCFAAICFITKHNLLGALFIAVGIFIIGIGLVPLIIKESRAKKAMKVEQKKIERREYRIVGDRLVRARLDAYAYYRNDPIYRGGSDLLEFARYGSYIIPYGTNYVWSKDYSMSARGVFNTSIEGDKFYLVLVKNEHDREEIAMIYNAKLFELTEDDPFEYEELS